MQDDIADGARWAIARGTADAQRICIAGASYGGYATLMGWSTIPICTAAASSGPA
jgi:dipeptidyl aminopeptidase/acylaminoacyl peptidase